VVPEFYARDSNGIPAAWVARVRESMGRLTPRFSANRTVREYTEKYYLPASAAYRERASGESAMAVRLLNWRRALEQGWPDLRFGGVKVESGGGRHAFEVQVYLAGLEPEAIRVELYAEGTGGEAPIRQEMVRDQQLAGGGGYHYSAEVPSDRPAADYTPRIVPWFPGASIPLEATQILWQR